MDKLPPNALKRHDLGEMTNKSNIRSPEEIMKAEEEFLGRPLTPHEQQLIHDRIEYLKEHKGITN
jgi:hypothetical protein